MLILDTDSTGRRPTIPELLSFAQNTLKANYIFWARSPEDFTKVLEALSRLNLANDASGGLVSVQRHHLSLSIHLL
jgi:hypothetical protein